MAAFPNSAPAPKFHLFIIKGRAGDFPASKAERLALYAASALRPGDTTERQDAVR